jgi:hypothetical protein
MQTYSLSELQANPAFVLHQADIDDTVLVELDGRHYQIRPIVVAPTIGRSPLDVPRVKLSHPVTIDDIIDDIQAGRERR